MTKKVPSAELHVSDGVLHDIRRLIEETRSAVASTVNAALTVLHWQVGKRINDEILEGDRAGYGEQIVHALSAQLQAEYGNGFSEKSIRRMMQFAESFADGEIVATLSRQLSWSHFIELLPLKQDLQRDFYAELCRVERWSVRTLRQKIGGMLYERTALSRKPEELIRHELDALRNEDRLTPDLVFRDPYFLDFLGLTGAWQEKDLESAILRELETFLMELGAGFTFVARQKRIIVDGDDFYLDLLFFHRGLRRLVAIELKLDKFRPEHKGQMELYLRWLDRYERKAGEEHPLGLILCAGKSDERVELLELGKSGIRVAEYLTELPSREMLERKLHAAMEHARQRYENMQFDVLQKKRLTDEGGEATVKDHLTARPRKKRGQ